ncbi:tRNA (guanine(46)-N(7))-methyltransferase TrmB [Azonexus sp.]|uniref:tRNA (guanine(46)-N(7))-methyltransferase TrmB n=1 Tax=Azonexus sp. TaxID=1872668 RepID=UPI0039E4D822
MQTESQNKNNESENVGQGKSRPVFSAQTGIHADLERQFHRHLAQPWRKPFASYNEEAYAQARAAHVVWNAAAPLILDAGCGVGWSTLHLAQTFPEHFVIGVDQSAARLLRGKPQALPENAVLVRADLVDFWRLLAQNGLRLARHYNLYPNPWPKIGHLSRRWHGHAVFPVWRALGGVVECRSNWRIYIEEMAQALTWLAEKPVVAKRYVPEKDMTPFEQKYRTSGHALWRCEVDFG